eukprot:2835254-Amphidinium_carterae.3
MSTRDTVAIPFQSTIRILGKECTTTESLVEKTYIADFKSKVWMLNVSSDYEKLCGFQDPSLQGHISRQECSCTWSPLISVSEGISPSPELGEGLTAA